MKILSIFVAFLENTNFKKTFLLIQKLYTKIPTLCMAIDGSLGAAQEAAPAMYYSIVSNFIA